MSTVVKYFKTVYQWVKKHPALFVAAGALLKEVWQAIEPTNEHQQIEE